MYLHMKRSSSKLCCFWFSFPISIHFACIIKPQDSSYSSKGSVLTMSHLIIWARDWLHWLSLVHGFGRRCYVMWLSITEQSFLVLYKCFSFFKSTLAFILFSEWLYSFQMLIIFCFSCLLFSGTSFNKLIIGFRICNTINICTSLLMLVDKFNQTC